MRLGSVDVGFRTDRDTQWTRFGGGMEGLRLEADRSDINCRSIVAHFGDGSQQNVFSGQLMENRPMRSICAAARGGFATLPSPAGPTSAAAARFTSRPMSAATRTNGAAVPTG